MDTKEIKQALKDARTALKEKNYMACVQLCKSILKSDPKNYTALIVMGSCYYYMDKDQQCIEAYKFAIDINPNQIPAWQGIVQYYESKGLKSHPDLLEGYKRIAAYFSAGDDQSKYIETTMKFVGALIYQEDYEGALKCLRKLQKAIQELPVNIALTVVQVVGHLKSKPLAAEDDNLYLESLEALIDDAEYTKDEYYKTFYISLYKRNEIDRIVKHCLRKESCFNAVSYPTEYLCRLYVESANPMPYSDRIVQFANQLQKLNPACVYIYYAKGKYYFDHDEIGTCISWLKEGLSYKFNEHAMVVFAKAKLAFGDFRGAAEVVEDLLKQEKSLQPTNLDAAKILEIEALMGCDVSAAEERIAALLAAISYDKLGGPVDLLRAKLCIWKRDSTTLKEILPTLSLVREDVKDVASLVVAQHENFAEDLEQRLSKEDVQTDLRIIGGILLWTAGRETQSVNIMSKLSKLNNYHPMPLMYMAKLYQAAGKPQSAVTQAEAAYRIYPSKEAGILLSDLYFEVGEIDKNETLLNQATKTAKKSLSKWAWYRLGLLYLSKPDKINDATVALQSAVRTDYNDGHLWETLADAYLARGSFHAALKSYNKALELNVNPMYPKFKIGMIYQQLNEHQKAIEAFCALLSDGSNYIPAMLELARTYYFVAKLYIYSKRDIAGADAIGDAVLWAVRSAKLDPKKALPWKIIGDCSLLVGDCASSLTIQVPSILLGFEDDDGRDPVELSEFLRIGTNCFLMALKVCQEFDLKTSIAEIYHNLGQSNRLRAMRSKDSDSRYKFLSKAVGMLKIAISKSKTNPVFWNTLGVIASSPELKLKQLAQHAFIRSIQIDPSNSIPWCNLGMLHYHAENYMSAHRCFSKAQTLDPTNGYCWMGQCLSAEALKPEDAVDLYRHTCLLDNFPATAVVGYTDWVCRFLASGNTKEEHYVYVIEKCEGVRTCFDLTSFYCVRRPSDAIGHLYKGYLAGRLGLLQTAKESFENCLKTVRTNEPTVSDAARINLAATLMQMDDVPTAKMHMREILIQDFTYHSLNARIYDKEDDHDACQSSYSKALELTQKACEKAEVHIGLGIVHGKCGRMEEAKTCVFQGWQLCRDKINGLLALVALCLQKEELTDADAAISKAVYHQVSTVTEYSQMNDIAFVQAAWHLVQDDIIGGRNCILKIAHRYPWNSQLWNSLAHYLLEANGILEASNVRMQIRKAVMRANIWERSSEILIALSYLLENNVEQGLRFAKKAVHAEPHKATTWAMLLFALHLYAKESKKHEFVTAATSVAKRIEHLCTEQDRDLHGWLQEYSSACFVTPCVEVTS